MTEKIGSKTLWTFVITSIALVMVTLDNLVVTTALPVIRHDLHATLEGLEWTVNAYTLTFAVLLLTGAALGDRFGRRLMFSIGLGIFTVASAAAALAPSIGALDGGAVVDGISWHWIFWLNVPIGIALIPLAFTRLTESYGPGGRLDLPGLGLASAGLFGIVWGLVRGNSVGWGSPEIVVALVGGAIVTAAFVAWELRTAAPMLPMRFFRNRTFALANVSSLFMFFGMFGSIFFLSQFFQTVQGYSPLGSGLRILPWTAMPMIVAPIAGALSDRIGGQKLMGAGLTLQALGLGWIAQVSSPATAYAELVGPFIISGIGMALFFAPVANVVLSAVRREEEGQASGANNAIRELGGVFGVAVLAAVFAQVGSYRTGDTFVHGMNVAVWIGAAIVLVGAVAAFLIPQQKRRAETVELEPAYEAAA